MLGVATGLTNADDRIKGAFLAVIDHPGSKLMAFRMDLDSRRTTMMTLWRDSELLARQDGTRVVITHTVKQFDKAGRALFDVASYRQDQRWGNTRLAYKRKNVTAEELPALAVEWCRRVGTGTA